MDGSELIGARRVTEADRLAGRNLRSLRKAASLSLPQLAERTGISYQQLQKYETGKNRMSVGALVALAKALNGSIADFIDFEPSEAENAKTLLRLKSEAIDRIQASLSVETLLSVLRVFDEAT